MAVHGDWSRIVDEETLHSDEFEWSMTETLFVLGWGQGLLYYLGLGSLTEKNIGEAIARYKVLMGLGVVEWRKDVEGHTPDESWLVRRIGVSSNIITLTRTQWLSQIVKPILDEVAQQTLNSLKKEETTV